ncbi:MAG: TIGR03564 family F420-dependent LLM class oxidoreductase [Acidimicrobiales bacterium]|jgi:F420-dependent oxidoreductase-like protein|nr:TIGR03564 family F420-dependent LLM class oxidoreductase [Acidimicrobiales bacterium]
MRIGINFSNTTMIDSLEPVIESARQCDADGFASWWLPQAGYLDALTVFAAVAETAPRIEFGTAVIPTWLYPPHTLAAKALTTAAVVGDRLTLGVGLSHQAVVEKRLRMTWDRPVRHAIDYLSVLNPMLDDGRVDYDGDIHAANGRYAMFTDRRPSVLLGALGPQMLRVAGRHAAGTITWLTGPKTLRDHIVPRVRDAAEAAEKPAPRVVASLIVTVTDDEAGVRERHATNLAGYGSLPTYAAMLDREGVDNPGEICLVGDEARVREQLATLAAAGVTDFAAVEVGTNPEEKARTRDLLKTAAKEAT